MSPKLLLISSQKSARIAPEMRFSQVVSKSSTESIRPSSSLAERDFPPVELKPIHEKILEELNEELGIGENAILSIHLGKPYEFTDVDINKTWLVHPVLVELKERSEIKLDWEHTEFKWINPEELKNFDVVPKLEESLKKALK